MTSVPSYTDNSAVENFREYLRIKTVQPKPDYGINNLCYYYNYVYCFL